jgi:hypothetical protein
MNHISMSRALALSASTVTACLPSRADTDRSIAAYAARAAEVDRHVAENHQRHPATLQSQHDGVGHGCPAALVMSRRYA